MNNRLEPNKQLEVIEKVLPPTTITDRYVYLRVKTENNEWSDPQCLAEMHAPKLVVVRLEE